MRRASIAARSASCPRQGTAWKPTDAGTRRSRDPEVVNDQRLLCMRRPGYAAAPQNGCLYWLQQLMLILHLQNLEAWRVHHTVTCGSVIRNNEGSRKQNQVLCQMVDVGKARLRVVCLPTWPAASREHTHGQLILIFSTHPFLERSLTQPWTP